MKQLFLFLFIIGFSGIIHSQQSYIFYNFNTERYTLEDVKGETISAEYDEIQSKKGSFYITKLNNKQGIINENGKILLDNVYDNIYTDDGFIIVKKDRKKGVYDSDVKLILPIEYDKITITDNYIAVTKNGKLGAFNYKGEQIIPFEYDLSTITEPTFFRFNKNKKAGVIDLMNNTIIPFEYYWIDKFTTRTFDFPYLNDNKFSTTNLYCAIKEENNTIYAGVFNDKGENILPVIYENIYNIYSNNLIGVSLNKKAGFVNLKNEIIIPFMYDEALPFNDNVSSVKLNNRYGVINDKNELIIPISLYDGHFVFRNGISKFTKYTNNKRKYGFINNLGKIVIPEIYDDAEYLSTGYFRVRIGTKFGIVSTSGKEVIPTVYDGIIIFGGNEDKDKFIVIKDKKYGVIDDKNDIKIPFKYDYIQNSGNFVMVAKNGLYGFYNDQFELIIPITYLKAKNFKDSNRISVLDANHQSYNINEKAIRTTKPN